MVVQAMIIKKNQGAEIPDKYNKKKHSARPIKIAMAVFSCMHI